MLEPKLSDYLQSYRLLNPSELGTWSWVNTLEVLLDSENIIKFWRRFIKHNAKYLNKFEVLENKHTLKLNIK